MIDSVEFLGLDFDVWTPDRAREWLAKRTADSPYAYVVTPNVDHMVRLSGAPEDIQCAYADADVRLCDSRILARLADFAGVTLSVVPGSDLTAQVFEQVLQPGDRVCLIGGDGHDGDMLAARYPGITIIQHLPPMGLRHDAAARADAVDAAVAAQGRFVLFAVGSPQQELLAHEMAARADARGTGLCIGASIDFLIGRQNRAPRIVQRMSMEWAWRLLTDPRRLAKRYLVEAPAIFPMVLRWRLEARASAAVGTNPARFGTAHQPEVDGNLPEQIERREQKRLSADLAAAMESPGQDDSKTDHCDE
jgi:N-acetylglucosaminyldiphosphoundecaprenol N-acetyl-beta-D-mannosaminyltransferase